MGLGDSSPVLNKNGYSTDKKTGAEIRDISASRLSHGDPWAFRPILANGLVLSVTTKGYL